MSMLKRRRAAITQALKELMNTPVTASMVDEHGRVRGHEWSELQFKINRLQSEAIDIDRAIDVLSKYEGEE